MTSPQTDGAVYLATQNAVAAYLAAQNTAQQVMSLAQYLNAQQRIQRAVVVSTSRAFTRWGAPETEAQQRQMAQRVTPGIQRARQKSYDLTTQMMRQAAPLVDPAPIRPYTSQSVESTLAEVVEQVEQTKMEPRKARVRVRELDQVSRKPRVRVTEVAGARLARHAVQAGRDAVHDTAEASGERLGWARVLTGDENCAWCVMLASRGPSYATERGALKASGRRGNRKPGEKYHDHCDCQAVLVYKGQDWPGKEQFELYEDLWAEATKGHSGKHALNALRRQLDRAQREGLSHQDLLDALRAEHQ